MIELTMEEELIVKSLRDFVENEVKPMVYEIEEPTPSLCSFGITAANWDLSA